MIISSRVAFKIASDYDIIVIFYKCLGSRHIHKENNKQ